MSDPRENFGRRWAEAEIAVVRAEYGKTPTRELAARLNRSVMSVQLRASILECAPASHWTAEEDDKLTVLWWATLKNSPFYTILARQLGRTPAAVYCRAKALGLPFGIPDGHESLQAAADRCGVYRKQLRKILAEAGVPVSRLPREPWRRDKIIAGKYHVNAEAVDAAVANFFRNTETVNGAADRMGVGRQWMSLRVSILIGARSELKPGSPRRIPSDVVRAAVRLMSATEIADRWGVRLQRAAQILGRYGATRAFRTFMVSPEESRRIWRRAKRAGLIDDQPVLTWRGKTRTVTEWSEMTGISRGTILSRRRAGWSIERSLFRPVKMAAPAAAKEAA